MTDGDARDTNPGASRAAVVLATTLSLVVLVAAVMQCRAWGGAVNADGISYLDLAALFRRGEAGALANGYWSPLYPLVLAAALASARVPSHDVTATLLTSEMRVVFVVDAVLLLAATLAFARLLAALDRAEGAGTPRGVRICRLIAGGALWIWCAVRLIGATTITPDTLLAAWLFLLTAELVLLGVRVPSRGRAAAFSAVAGLAYWTKAVFFPVLIVAIASYVLLARRGTRRAVAPWLVLPALAISAPLVIVQSVSQGHLSFGETGRLNYRWYVGGAPHADPLDEPVSRTRARPANAPAVIRVAAAPNAALYHDVSEGTFPYWLDPSRFEPATPIAFSAGAQWGVLRLNLHWYRVVAGAFAMWIALAFAAALARQGASARRLVIAGPTLLLLVLYALTHPEGRLAGSAIVCALAIALFPGGPPRRASAWGRLRWVECTALVVVAILAVGRTAKRVTSDAAPAEALASPAAGLAKLGVRAGSRIGIVGSPYGHYWAHQAGVRIVVGIDQDAPARAFGAGVLAAIVAEACARGTPLAGIVWRGEVVAPGAQGFTLPGGWRAWVAPACGPA